MTPTEIALLRDQACENLCIYDERSPYRLDLDPEFIEPPRDKRCCCDPCFQGRDKLAMAMLALLERLENPWVEVTEEQRPELGLSVVYWHRGNDPSFTGYPAIADEYMEHQHGLFASHFIPNSHKDPYQP
jgi:hypothetical protein